MSPTPKNDPVVRAAELAQRAFVCGVIATLAIGLTSAAGTPPTRMLQLPTGKPVGVVAFDCVIQANAPMAGEQSAFFLTYAVSPEAIAYDILWAEPCWETVNFPCPPAGLSVHVGADAFLARHTLNNVDWTHSLPTAARGVFNHTCNNYPVDESRFAYQESLARRLTTDDLPALERAFPGMSPASAARSTIGESLSERPGRPATQAIVLQSPDMTQLTLLTGQPPEVREFGYSFVEGKLTTLLGILHEVTVPVGGFEIRAASPEFPQHAIITQLPARRHPGGREVFVTFEENEVNGLDVDLPNEITVKEQHQRGLAQGADLLRRATISNYRTLPSMPSPEAIGSVFTTDPLFGREQEFRKLLASHWMHPTDTVPEADAAWLETFAADCERLIATEPRLPIRLKLRFMSIVSDLITGHHDRAETIGFQAYLAELRGIGLADIADRAAVQFASIREDWGNID